MNESIAVINSVEFINLQPLEISPLMSACEIKVLYIGDTVHDFEVASILGADCALYAGGHHDRERLEACGVAVFDDFRELIQIIK